MKTPCLRGPFGHIERSLAVMCLAFLTSATGCGAENHSSEGAGAAANAAPNNDAIQEPNEVNASPWGPDEDCRPWGCAENAASQAIIAPPSIAQTCTTGAECGSGFCVDGVCCDTACTSTCQACSAAKKGQGTDGVCGNIALYGDPDNECASGACDGTGQCKTYNGVTCTGTTTCLSGYCVDGYCCGSACTGSCQACSFAKRGSGSNGQCGNIASGTDPDNECANADCNGSGACVGSSPTNQLNGTPCTANSQCASGYCVDGYCCGGACTGLCQACSIAKRGGGFNGQCGFIASGTDPDNECAAVCNGSGACTLPTNQLNGKPCSQASQCASGNCVDGVCCGAACTETCRACTAAKKGSGSDGQCGTIAAGTDPDNECPTGECSGTASCTSTGGTIPTGSACTAAASCISGFCVDGVCCDKACTGSCEACTATKKGSGSNGVCGFIAANTNPDSECVAGRCNGSGACFYFNGAACTTTAQCMSGYCVDGYCCNGACAETCRSCSAAKKGSGSNGSCGFIAVSTDPDNECGGDCNGAGVCSLGANGVACTTGSACTSGFCVDGVCCNTACTDTCLACNLMGTAGTCSPIPEGAPDSNSTPLCTGVCSGDGVCQLPNGSACTSGSQCTSHVCDDKLCAAVQAPINPFRWATILSPTTDSTIDMDWLTPLANGGIAGAGSKTGAIDLNGWMLASGPSQSQPWSFTFNAAGSPTNVSDNALNDADNETTYLRARARYSDIVVTQHWFHGGGASVYTSQLNAPTWNRTFNDTEVTSLHAGDGGHVLIAATVSPDNMTGVDFGDGTFVTGDRLVKYGPTGAVEFNVATGLVLGAVLDPAGNFYDISRQTTSMTIAKQDGQGNPLWTKTIPMTVGSTIPPSFGNVFDESGNLLLAFNFNGSVDFGNGAIAATGINDLGLAKLDAAGNAIWTKRFGTATFNLTTVFTDFTGPDDIAVIGYFQGTANLGQDDFTGGRFVAKFDETGTLVWRSAPPTVMYALTGSPSGAVFIGTTNKSADFGWGAPLAGTGGLVIAKYSN